jgi:hypothetical protein
MRVFLGTERHMLDLLPFAIGVYETLAERNMISASGDGIVRRMFIKTMILDFIQYEKLLLGVS